MVNAPESLSIQTVPTRGSAVASERRVTPRQAQDAAARLVGWGGTDPVSCTIRDVGEGGLFVHVPASCGLGVGRRYEIVLDADRAPAGLADAWNDGCYATVVRTQPVGDQVAEMIGAGLRFDRPLVL